MRKTSATSSEVRTASAVGRPLLTREHGQLIERADDGADRAGRDLGVEGGVLQLGVAEQRLDHANIDAVLEQMRGEAVPQRMRADALGDTGRVRRLDDDAMKLAGADRLACVLPRKQPAVAVHDTLLTPDLPPLAQQSEQIAREHGVAILAALAALDPEQHALAVDIRDLEVGDFGDAQPRTISDRQRRLMLETGCRL